MQYLLKRTKQPSTLLNKEQLHREEEGEQKDEETSSRSRFSIVSNMSFPSQRHVMNDEVFDLKMENEELKRRLGIASQ